MLTESFDNMSGNILNSMFYAAKNWACDEMVDIINMGKCRNVRMLQDTHVGLPLPEIGDFIFEGDVEGITREFLVRNYSVIWSRPKYSK